MKVIIEHNKEADLLSQENSTFLVKYEEKDATIEKRIKYKPLEADSWKYQNGTLVEYRNQLFELVRYTTWVRDGVLKFYYSLNGISRFDDNTKLSEEEVETKCTFITATPFLSRDVWEEKYSELLSLTTPLKKQISELQSQMAKHEEEYGLEKKCRHSWYLSSEEEINNGKTTEKIYECEICGKVDKHYWHSF